MRQYWRRTTPHTIANIKYGSTSKYYVEWIAMGAGGVVRKSLTTTDAPHAPQQKIKSINAADQGIGRDNSPVKVCDSTVRK